MSARDEVLELAVAARWDIQMAAAELAQLYGREYPVAARLRALAGKVWVVELEQARESALASGRD